MTRNDVSQSLRKYLTKENIRYDYIDQNDLIGIPNERIPSKIQTINIVIVPQDDSFMVYAFAPISIDEAYKNEVLRYLNLINDNCLLGSFSLNEDSLVKWKYCVACNGLTSLPDDLIMRPIVVLLGDFTRFGDGIAALSMGFSSAEVEFEKAHEK